MAEREEGIRKEPSIPELMIEPELMETTVNCTKEKSSAKGKTHPRGQQTLYF